MANSNENGSTRQARTRGATRPNYTRHSKPPFSFVELITIAIDSSLTKMLTLREITEYLERTFPCFQGDYVGWKNSVRHNLSASGRFDKVLRDFRRPFGKDNYWAVKPNSKLDIKKMQARLVSYFAKDAPATTAGEKQTGVFTARQNSSNSSPIICNVTSGAQALSHFVDSRQLTPVQSNDQLHHQSDNLMLGMPTYGHFYQSVPQGYPSHYQHTAIPPYHQQEFGSFSSYTSSCQYDQNRTTPSDHHHQDNNGVSSTTHIDQGTPWIAENRDQEAPSSTTYEAQEYCDETLYWFADDEQHLHKKSSGSHVEVKRESQWSTPSAKDDGCSEYDAPLYDRTTECMYTRIHNNNIIVNSKTGTYQSVRDVLDEMSAMVDDTSVDSLAELAMAQYQVL